MKLQELKDSPSGAKVFYDEENDRCILEYDGYTLIYSERIDIKSNSKLPHAFKLCNGKNIR